MTVLPQEFAFQHPVSPGGDWPAIIGTPDDEPAPSENVRGIFPVGSVFLAVVSTNPATLLGYGTWQQIGAGRVLVGIDTGDADFDTVEETGGSKTDGVSVSGSTGSEASHTHGFSGSTGSPDATTTKTPDGQNAAGPQHGHSFSGSTGSGSSHGHSFSGSGSTSTVQPYFVVYMWKRTA